MITMIRESFLKISLVSFGNIFNSVLGLVFLTAVAKALPLEDFGRYALLTSVLVSLSKIMDFGTNSNFVTDSVKNTFFPEEQNQTFVTLKAVLYVVSLLIAAVVLLLFGISNPQIYLLFMLGLLGYAINLTLFPFFHREEKYHWTVSLNTIPALIKGGLGAAILLGLLNINLTASFGIFSLSVLSCTVLYVLLPSNAKPLTIALGKNKEGIFETVGKLKTTFTRSIPAGITLFINNGWPAVANSIAKLAQNFSNVGIFSLADKVANVFSLISLSIFTVLLQKNSARKKEHAGYNFKESLFLAAGVLALAVVAIIIAPPILKLVFGDKFIESTEILGVLILAAAITAIHTFMENYFFVENKTTVMAKISVSKLLVFLSLCAILVPRFSLQGLATSQFLAAVLGLGLATYFTIKVNKKKALPLNL